MSSLSWYHIIEDVESKSDYKKNNVLTQGEFKEIIKLSNHKMLQNVCLMATAMPYLNSSLLDY